MTNQASGDEINSFMKNFRSKAHVNFRKDGETVAYGWKPSDMKREIASLIRTEKLKLLDEVIHQSTVNLSSARGVAGWAEFRKKQLEAEL